MNKEKEKASAMRKSEEKEPSKVSFHEKAKKLNEGIREVQASQLWQLSKWGQSFDGQLGQKKKKKKNQGEKTYLQAEI